uniref:Transcription factor Adf-1 n=1 Tax=Lygus hesperus TaxID=30085 RepID=A0A0A9WJB0_LYGHE
MSEDTFNEELIEEVKANEQIWNTAHSDHRRASMLDAVWYDIGIKLNRAPAQCRKRWKTLRDRFKRENNRLKGSEGQAASSWPLYTLLTFLRPSSSPRPARPSLMKTEVIEQPAINNYTAGTLPDHTYRNSSTVTEFYKIGEQSDLPHCDPLSTVEVQAIPQYVNQPSTSQLDLSPDELWFLAIGKELKTLPKKRRIHVRQATMKALYEDLEDEEVE